MKKVIQILQYRYLVPYNRKEDLSSPMYGYNRDNTLTFMGTVPLSSDHDGEK